MKRHSILIRNLFIVFVLFLVSACASQKEFQVIPQAGANRTGVYPRFSDKLQAETAQFSREEEDHLMKELGGDAQRLLGSIHPQKKEKRIPADLK